MPAAFVPRGYTPSTHCDTPPNWTCHTHSCHPCIAPVIVTPTGHTGVDGSAFTITNSLSAGTTPVTWSLSGTVPGGVAINPSTGTITGNHGASTFSLTVVATNACGMDSKTVTLTTGVCTAPVMNDPTPPSGVAGDALSITNSVSAGTTPIVWSLTGTIPSGVTINSSSGTVSGLFPGDSTTLTIRATNACGFASKTVAITVVSPPTAHKIIWGNFDRPGFPTAAPTFVESDFISNPELSEKLTSDSTILGALGLEGGNYPFTGEALRLQVMWVADSVSPTSGRFFNEGGFPWGLNPAANTHHQTLTVAGVPGKVYVTTFTNANYTVTAG